VLNSEHIEKTRFKYGLVTQDNVPAEAMDGRSLSSGVYRTANDGSIWKPAPRANSVALTSPFTILPGNKKIALIYYSIPQPTDGGMETKGIGKWIGN